jgi:AcrR family transcriptional regulator
MTFRAEFAHRDDLLRAALDEFSERGFEAASINKILATSGVSKGQLYHHFGSKEGLYLALVEWMIDEKIAWLAANPPAPADEDFFAALESQIRSAVDFAAAHPDVDRFTRSLLADRGHAIFEAVTNRFGFTADSALAALVEHHHAHGAFRSDLPLGFIQRVVSLVVNRAPDLLAIDEPTAMARGADDLLAFLRDGIARRP